MISKNHIQHNTDAVILFVTGNPEEGELISRFLKNERNDQVIIILEPTHERIQAAVEDGGWVDLILIQATYVGKPDPVQLLQDLRNTLVFQETPILFWRVALSPEKFYPQARELKVAGCLGYTAQLRDLLTARDTVLNGKTYYP